MWIFTSRTVWLVASHGHISVLRQRASANSKHCQHDALPVCFLPRTTRCARPHHGAMAYGPVDAGSCFCEADAMLGGFSRVAQSCSLRRTGTYPCSVSERLRIASTASVKHCQCGLPLSTRGLTNPINSARGVLCFAFHSPSMTDLRLRGYSNQTANRGAGVKNRREKVSGGGFCGILRALIIKWRFIYDGRTKHVDSLCCGTNCSG